MPTGTRPTVQATKNGLPFAWQKRVVRGLLAGLGALLLAAALHIGDLTTSWEARSWDWRARMLAQPAAAHQDIVMILLDQNSLDWAQAQHGLSWPWPRELYGAIIEFCRRGGAQSMAFDVLILEPSAYGVADDAALGAAIADFGPFVAAAFPGETTGSRRQWPDYAPAPPWQLIEPEPPAATGATRSWPRQYPRAALPIAEVLTAATLPANVQLAPDADTVYRRAPLLVEFDHRLLPVLGMAPYLALNPQARLQRKPNGLLLDDYLIPLDQEGRALLRYRGPAGTFPAFSAAAVLQAEIRLRQGETTTLDPEIFRDRHVFFGFSAPGLYDLRPTPMGGLYPGVEIHATILDNLLSRDFMRPTPALVDYLLLGFFSLAPAIILSFLAAPLLLVPAVILLASLPPLLALAAYQQGWWLPLVLPVAGLAGAVFLALLGNFVTEGRQRRFIKNAFRQYLSPDVIEEIVRHPERLQLGGERRELSIFFSDLQGFTSISEGLEPEALTALLNEYLSAMTEIIHEEGGTVDKYEGDAIIAFWNAPLAVPDHARRAVRAALRCQQTLADMRPALKQRASGHELHMRIGINTGKAVVGNMGSHSRFDYTMLGDAVNLAARLEGANKEFGTWTMVSATTCQAAGLVPVTAGGWPEELGQQPTDQLASPPAEEKLTKTILARELARLVVVGRQEPVTVYEPLLPEQATARRQELQQFNRGLTAFCRGDLIQAATIFDRLSGDAAARAYSARCRLLQEKAPDNQELGTWLMAGK